MTIFYRTVLRIFLLTGILALCKCNRVSDLQPVDGSVPDAVVQMIPDLFPGAGEIEIRTVEKDSLWEADYTLDGERYYVGMDTETVRYQARVMGSVVPEEVRSVISGLSIGGGEFGLFIRDLTASVNCTKYRFRDADYRLEWETMNNGQVETIYAVRLSPYSKIRYPLYSTPLAVFETAKIPAGIRQYLAARYLDLTGAAVHIDESNRKEYLVNTASLTNQYKMRFDKALRLISTTYSPEQIFYTPEEIPEVIIRSVESIVSPEEFSYVSGRKYSTEAGATYILKMKSKTGGESYDLELSGSGNLLYLEYSGSPG